MRALVAGPEAEGRFAEVPEPVPGPDQALVEVHHVSVNFSDLRHMGRLIRARHGLGHLRESSLGLWTRH
ncbi:hypothetical protein AB0J09_45165, partial [Nonomuraea sp. NPDC049784]